MARGKEDPVVAVHVVRFLHAVCGRGKSRRYCFPLRDQLGSLGVVSYRIAGTWIRNQGQERIETGVVRSVPGWEEASHLDGPAVGATFFVSMADNASLTPASFAGVLA